MHYIASSWYYTAIKRQRLVQKVYLQTVSQWMREVKENFNTRVDLTFSK
jgi:hypothetical protein